MVTPPGMEDQAKEMKPSFKKRYGDRWKEVLYRTLWKQHNEEKDPDWQPVDPEKERPDSGYYPAKKKKKVKEEIESLNEISKTTAAVYAQGAHNWIKQDVASGRKGNIDKIVKRQEGVFRAVSKFKGDKKFAIIPAKGGGRNMTLRYPVTAGHPLNKEETKKSFKEKGGWNDQGDDYLDMSDEEQEGLKQALRKQARDRVGMSKRPTREETIDRIKSLVEHIVKTKGGFKLVSKKSGKNLGTAKTKAGIVKREREVEYFKHHKG